MKNLELKDILPFYYFFLGMIATIAIFAVLFAIGNTARIDQKRADCYESYAKMPQERIPGRCIYYFLNP